MKRFLAVLVSLVLMLTMLSGCVAKPSDATSSTVDGISSNASATPPSPDTPDTPVAPEYPAPDATPALDTTPYLNTPVAPDHPVPDATPAPSFPDEAFADMGASHAYSAETDAEGVYGSGSSGSSGGDLSVSSDLMRKAVSEAAEPVPMPTSKEALTDDTSGQSQSTYTRPGLLTAGVWNDNKNHDFIMNLIQTNADFRTFEKMWQFNLHNQIKVHVSDNGIPVNNARAELLDKDSNVIYSACTDNNGVAYLFVNLRNTDQNEAAYIRVSKATSDTVKFDPAKSSYEFSLSDNQPQQKKSLDLMFLIDTTGSMSDELEFLKIELEDIINQVSMDNTNMNIRLSVNVYRDKGDAYVLRSMPFEENIDSQTAFLRKQSADGGGDWEEAVEQALSDALEDHDWTSGATAKLLFMVLDAPPHNTAGIRDEMHRLTALSSEMGVRIIPIASSGIDKVTEFLFRSLSMATGGTYVFLTDHSGIGEAHIEPTIGPYEVELLNELIVRVINEYTM